MLPAARWNAVPQLDISAADFTVCAVCKLQDIEAMIRKEPWRGIGAICPGWSRTLHMEQRYLDEALHLRRLRDRQRTPVYETGMDAETRMIGHANARCIEAALRADGIPVDYQHDRTPNFYINGHGVHHHGERAKMEDPRKVRNVYVAKEQVPTAPWVMWSYYVPAVEVVHWLGFMRSAFFNNKAELKFAGETVRPRWLVQSDSYVARAYWMSPVKDTLAWLTTPAPAPWVDATEPSAEDQELYW